MPLIDSASRQASRRVPDIPDASDLPFLEEAFGGLVRTSDYSADQVLATLLFAPEDRFEVFIDAIREYIRNADKQ